MFRLALLIWVVLGTTLAGVGVTIVVSNPDLYNQGMKLIPIAASRICHCHSAIVYDWKKDQLKSI